MNDRLKQFGPTLAEANDSESIREFDDFAVDLNYVDLWEAANWIGYGVFGPPGIGPYWFTGWIDCQQLFTFASLHANGRLELARHQLLGRLATDQVALWGMFAKHECPRSKRENDVSYAYRRTVRIPESMFEQIVENVEDGMHSVADVYFDCLLIEHAWLTKTFEPGPPASMLPDAQQGETSVLQLEDGERSIISPSRGRPPKWDWEWLMTEVIVLANTPDGLPDKQADLETWAAEQFLNKYNSEPSASHIRKKVGPIYRRMRSKSQ